MVSDNENKPTAAVALAVDKILAEMKQGYNPDGYLFHSEGLKTYQVIDLLRNKTGIQVMFRTPAVDVKDSYRILLAQPDVASYSAQEKQVDKVMDKLKDCMKTNPWAPEVTVKCYGFGVKERLRERVEESLQTVQLLSDKKLSISFCACGKTSDESYYMTISTNKSSASLVINEISIFIACVLIIFAQGGIIVACIYACLVVSSLSMSMLMRNLRKISSQFSCIDKYLTDYTHDK